MEERIVNFYCCMIGKSRAWIHALIVIQFHYDPKSPIDKSLLVLINPKAYAFFLSSRTQTSISVTTSIATSPRSTRFIVILGKSKIDLKGFIVQGGTIGFVNGRLCFFECLVFDQCITLQGVNRVRFMNPMTNLIQCTLA